MANYDLRISDISENEIKSFFARCKVRYKDLIVNPYRNSLYPAIYVTMKSYDIIDFTKVLKVNGFKILNNKIYQEPCGGQWQEVTIIFDKG